MKKILLFLAVVSISMSVGAQERNVMLMQGRELIADSKLNKAALRNSLGNSRYMPQVVADGAHKTTGIGKRWYNYGEYMRLKSAYDVSVGVTNYVDQYYIPIWNDTNVWVSYMGSPAHLNMPSVGNVLDPTFPGFNSSLLYGSGFTLQVNASEAYSVDSIIVPGLYQYGSKSTLAAAEVDTLRLVFVTGAGGTYASGDNIFAATTVSSHYGTVTVLDIPYDSIINTSASNNGMVAIAGKMDILLRNSDTSSTKLYAKAYAITPEIPVPAGNWVATSITYKSGEPDPVIHLLPGDTVIGSVAPYTYYNVFRPVVNFWTTTDPTTVTGLAPAAWAPFGTYDKNEGLFKTWPNYEGGWGDMYVPMWGLATSSPSNLQYPEVAYHVKCPSCLDWSPGGDNVRIVANDNKIKALPNPADNELNISFTLGSSSDVKVSLTNMLGQVVAAEHINSTTEGSIIWNTGSLPAGMYIYKVQANGEVTTGKVVVRH
ncbi:MAG: hypothetical protein JWQ38_3176 [Flavipsychrobacter sp.]|nr:hypothetical protein [Flavipsychrobacter sp.]